MTGVRASNVVLAVAKACKGAEEEVMAQLESDLQQLTGYVIVCHDGYY